MFTSTEIRAFGSDEGELKTVYLARQPILNSGGGLAGYELLFRAATGELCLEAEGVKAVSNLIRNAFFGAGLKRILSGGVGFIPVDASFLLSDLVESLEPRSVVLEILHSVELDPALLSRVKQLRLGGYRFAWVDFRGEAKRIRPFLEFIDIVRLDLTRMSPDSIAMAILNLNQPRIRLLAESVETDEQFQMSKALGFSLFQGFHFARPGITHKQGLRMPHQDHLLRLIGLVQDPGNDRELLAELKHHPAVAVRMLRIANSSAAGRGEPVSSISSAMRVLGRRQVQRIINVLLFVGKESGALQRNPLFQLACSRGKLAEDLVEMDPDATIEEQEGAFLSGMLSVVEGLLAEPLHLVLDELQLSDTLVSALLRRQGRLGDLLTLIEALEFGDNETVARMLAAMPHLSDQNLMRTQLEAFAWAGELSAS